jgi:RHS repeat-associated protein
MSKTSSSIFLLGALGVGCGGQVGPGAEGDDQAAVTLSITLANQVGRISATGNGAGHVFRTYDTEGRETAAQYILNGGSYTHKRTYGFPCSTAACTGTVAAADGSTVISETFPDNEVVTYTFDSGGGQQSIKTTPSGGVVQTIVSRILRNSRGQTIQVDYGDKTSTTHHYNDTTNLRLNQIETYLTATPTTILQLYTYAFDNDGNVAAINDYCNENSTSGSCTSATTTMTDKWTYQYDPRSQLVSATRTINGAANVWPYAYDAIGNLTNKEGVTQNYWPSGAGKPHPHALSSIGPVVYSYDNNGNLYSRAGGGQDLAITWNADNMPVALTSSTGTTTKQFIGEKLWAKRQTGVTTYYLPQMRVENGLFRKYFDHFAERDISDKTSCTTNKTFGCLKFYHGDHLGSSTLVTNDAAVVVHRMAYRPYGQDLVLAFGQFAPRYRYNFKEEEVDGTGFYDYGARLYDPAIGRFLSADPVNDGPNRYAYVSNNPLRYTDPTGHEQREATKTFINQYGEIIVERPDQPCSVRGNLPPRASMRAARVDDDPRTSGRADPGTLGLDWIAGGKLNTVAADVALAVFRGVASRLATPAVEAVAEAGTTGTAEARAWYVPQRKMIDPRAIWSGQSEVKRAIVDAKKLDLAKAFYEPLGEPHIRVSTTTVEGQYVMFDGNHTLRAALELGVTRVPALVDDYANALPWLSEIIGSRPIVVDEFSK